MKKLILITVSLLLASTSLFSQSDEVGEKYIYEFRDGTVIIGTFEKEEAGNIYIKDLDGKEIYIPSVMIAQRFEATDENIKDGEYWFPNLHDTRYFFAPSAFGLRKGEGYFGHSYWMLWQMQYGITDNFSIGGGATIFGLPSTVNGKYSFNIKNDINAALGYFWVGDLFGIAGEDERSFVNMPYAVITKGSKENNITLGIGYNLADSWIEDGHEEYLYGGVWDEEPRPNEYEDGYRWVPHQVDPLDRVTITAGGTFRAARRFSFIFEGWLFDINDEDPVLMGGPGIRYFRKINRVTAKNGAGAKTFDFQLLTSPEFDGAIIPMFGASQKF
jgi:hypothetical protein